MVGNVAVPDRPAASDRIEKKAGGRVGDKHGSCCL